jgi:hypothetical protein
VFLFFAQYVVHLSDIKSDDQDHESDALEDTKSLRSDQSQSSSNSIQMDSACDDLQLTVKDRESDDVGDAASSSDSLRYDMHVTVNMFM